MLPLVPGPSPVGLTRAQSSRSERLCVAFPQIPSHPEQPTDDSVGYVGRSTPGATRERQSKTRDDTTMHPGTAQIQDTDNVVAGRGAPPHATRASTVTLDSSPGSSTLRGQGCEVGTRRVGCRKPARTPKKGGLGVPPRDTRVTPQAHTGPITACAPTERCPRVLGGCPGFLHGRERPTCVATLRPGSRGRQAQGKGASPTGARGPVPIHNYILRRRKKREKRNHI